MCCLFGLRDRKSSNAWRQGFKNLFLGYSKKAFEIIGPNIFCPLYKIKRLCEIFNWGITCTCIVTFLSFFESSCLSIENLLMLIFSETFTSLRLWVTHVKNVKKKKKWGVTKLVAKIRYPKDHLKFVKLDSITKCGCSVCLSKNIATTCKSLKCDFLCKILFMWIY